MSKSVVGLESLLNKLNKLGGNVEETLYNSVAKQTKFVQGVAKELCPVDTGGLRERIKENTRKNKNEIVGTVHTNVEYAPYVEFGTGKVGETTPVADKYPGELSYKQDKWKVNIPDVGPRWIEGQPAQPFLYPALKNNEDKILENIKSDVKEAIREVAKK